MIGGYRDESLARLPTLAKTGHCASEKEHSSTIIGKMLDRLWYLRRDQTAVEHVDGGKAPEIFRSLRSTWISYRSRPSFGSSLSQKSWGWRRMPQYLSTSSRRTSKRLSSRNWEIKTLEGSKPQDPG